MNLSKNKKYMILTILLSFLLKTIAFMGNINISLIIDHIGYLALPTYLSNLDWSNLISKISYYGYGFKWVYTPFFLLTDNPYLIYISILLLYIILNSLLAGAIYFCVIKYGKVVDSLSTVLIISSIVTLLGSTISSENDIFMAFVVLCFFIIRLLLCNTIKQKRYYGIIIAFWMCYMLTIHKRCMALIIAFFITVFLLYFFCKKNIIEWISFVPAFLIFYFIQKQLTNYIIQLFWSEKSVSGTLKNINIVPSYPTWFLTSFTNIKIFFECIMSNIITLIIKTYGLGIFMIALFIIGFFSIFNNKITFIKIFKENITIVTIFILSSISVIIIIIGMTVQWGHGVATDNIYGYKGYTYYRYYFPFTLPGIIATFILLKKLDKKIQKIIKVMVCLIVPVLSIFFIFMYPVLSSIHQTRNIALQRMGLFLNISSITISRNIIISIFIVLFLIVIIVSGIKKQWLFYSLMLVFLVFFIQTKGLNIKLPKISCSSFDASYDFIKGIESDIRLPQQIYYYGKAPYNCQFMLNRYSVRADWPVDEENAIIFSDRAPSMLDDSIIENESCVFYIGLNENEYFYIKGEYYYKIFETNGCQLNSIY